MRIGTRRSALALAQAEFVSGLLNGAEIVPIVTGGDRGVGPDDKSRWVSELEQALLEGRIDLAVHSAKDLPGEQPEGLGLLGSPVREPAEDVICGAAGLDELRTGARIGTSSLRRVAQLRAAREDLDVVAIRGNVDTRLAKLARDDSLDAIVLARAGLRRLGREREAGGTLDLQHFIPAPGQGALALQGRLDDPGAAAAAVAITDPVALACLRAERAVAAALDADCHTPLGASAQPAGEVEMTLHAWVGLPDGSAWIADGQRGALAEPEELGAAVAARMRSAGAAELLAQAREQDRDEH